jgi:hypothetical protein
MWRPAIAATLLTLSACGGGGGSPAAESQAAVVAGLNATSPVVGWTQFIYPSTGQVSVKASHPFAWRPVSGAQAYQLQVGSSFGASDVFDSGIITATSVVVPNLPLTGALYARVRAIPAGWSTALSGGFPRATYVTFALDANVTGAAFTYPAAGATAQADTPISWQADPLARSYRLTIGSTAGGSDLLDTGSIHSTQRVVSGLPSGATVYATLHTTYAGNLTQSKSVSFIAGKAGITSAAMLAVARNLGAQVRGMADGDNQPLDGSALAGAAASEGEAVADCGAFTTALLAELADANVPLQARDLSICFNTNTYDCHELVEVLDTDSQRWLTIDPTFGLYALNAQGEPATAAEVSAAARALAFHQLSFTYLTAAGDAYAHAYYIDYPLLFLNVYQPGSTQDLVQAPPASLQPYFDLVGTAVNGTVSGYYAAECGSGYSSADADWDGTTQSYPCNNGFSPIVWAISVSVIPGDLSATAIWQTHRFVF